MKLSSKILWLSIGVTVVFGLLLAAIGFSLGASMWIYTDRTGVHVMDTEERDPAENNIVERNLDPFGSIDISLEYADMEIVPAQAYGIEIHSYRDWVEFPWSVENGVLKIEEKWKPSRAQTTYFNFQLGGYWEPTALKSTVKIYLPASAQLEDARITNDNGDMQLSGLQSRQLSIVSEYGKVCADRLQAEILTVKMGNGNFTSDNAVTGGAAIRNEYGDVAISNMTAQTLDVKMDNGTFNIASSSIEDIVAASEYGKLLFDDLAANSLGAAIVNGEFSVDRSTVHRLEIASEYGKISANALTSGDTTVSAGNGDTVLIGKFTGNTTISSEYGNVKLTLADEKRYYDSDLFTDYGDIKIDGETINSKRGYMNRGSGGHQLKIMADNGNIEVHFAKET